VVFFVTGFVVAAWATRIPAVQERLGLSPASFALAVLGLEGGALAGLPAGGALVARLGSRPCLRVGFALYPTALLGVALAPELGWLVAALAVMAAANSVVDVAMNAQGVELERRYRRPILSGLHAAHPLGMLAGGLGGTAAAAAGLTVLPHFALAATSGLLAGLAATRRLVSEPRQPRQPLLARPGGQVLLLGASPSAPSCSTARPATGARPSSTTSTRPAPPWPPPASAPSPPPSPWPAWPATA
jgi:MFS family permease